MDSQLLEIFKSISAEKHYAPCTYSEIPNGKTDLNITSGQNANWTYANFFIQNDNDSVNSFRINAGQYVIKKENNDWILLDYRKNICASGIEKIKVFVNSIKTNYENYLRTLNSFNGKIEGHPEVVLQQIFYGAPGTGKSYTINECTEGKSVIRTTFHPDSDYSSFVGAYKPTMGAEKPLYGFTATGGTVIAEDPKGTIVQTQKIEYKFVKQAFLKAYLKAWKFFSEVSASGVASAVSTSPNVSDLTDLTTNDSNNASLAKTVESVFLVIEEINRGNCAQIFGDIFQLLDRGDNGFSEYPIEADADIQKEIERSFKEDPEYKLDGMLNIDGIVEGYSSTTGKTLSEDIQSGHVMLLPNNLFIWATMNTSDQSLFPIDSAFKRRWEWKYVKIKEGKDSDGKSLDWKIVVKDGDDKPMTINGEDSLSWWKFIQKVNEIIASMTSSADKQLGYFFCKAENGVISGERFVSKVIFYLWNDVFKDTCFEDASLFRYEVEEDGKKVAKDLTFPDFYDEEGEKVNGVRLVDFLQKVMAWQKLGETE